MKKKLLFPAVILLVIVLILVLAELTKEPPFAGFTDGTYIGEASGYRKDLKAKVTLEKGYITDIQIIEHYEKGAEHYEEPMAVLPAAIIKAQSPDVDGISGATLTSNGIKDAVRAALAQARK